MDITIFDGARNTVPLADQYDWPELCELFEDASQKPWGRSAKLDQMAYIPGLLSGTRKAANVVHHSFGSYDIDVAGDDPSYIDFDSMRSVLDAMQIGYILATSTKSLKSNHRFRLIVRFEEYVPAQNHLAMWQHMNAQFGGTFDRSTHDASRLSFFPARWTGLPCDTNGQKIADWPEQDAFQAFACNPNGMGVALPDFSKLNLPKCVAAPRKPRAASCPPTQRDGLSAEALELLHQCEAAVPDRESPGYRFATDPANSLYVGRVPFGEIQGGRMFRFLCRVAARAFSRALPINSDLLFDLATAVNNQNGGPYRPDLRREVERALIKEARFISDARSHP